MVSDLFPPLTFKVTLTGNEASSAAGGIGGPGRKRSDDGSDRAGDKFPPIES
jgi:hypothetical protein